MFHRISYDLISVSESLSLNIGPIIVAPVGNQTAAVGREVVFSCSVRNIGKFKVNDLNDAEEYIPIDLSYISTIQQNPNTPFESIMSRQM